MRDLKADLEICRSTSPGTWYVVNPDDESFMNIIGVATTPDVADVDPTAPFNQELDSRYEDCDKIVALFLLQTPRLANIADEKWWQNARFLAEAHNGGWEEAIRRALAAEERVSELKAAIRRVIEDLGNHEDAPVYGPYGLAGTQCIVHDGKLCDILYDLQAVLDEGGEG